MGKKKKVEQKRPKKGRKPVRDTTVVVAVGCGGIFYHGLSRMATFCNRRLKVRVVLIDPDKVEKKNGARQWGGGVGQPKVAIASSLLGQLGDRINSITARMAPIDDPKDLVTMAGYDKEFEEYRRDMVKGYVGPYWERVVRVVVVSAPDNHLCRVNVHRGCGLLASETGVEVLDITAGNGPDYGYAYGCAHRPGVVVTRRALMTDPDALPNGKKEVRCNGDWTKSHPDIVSEARDEARRLAHPASCGAMEEVVPGQTMTTNMLTALCIWDLAEIMVSTEEPVGEVYWTREKDPRVEGNMINVVRAKLAERD